MFDEIDGNLIKIIKLMMSSIVLLENKGNKIGNCIKLCQQRHYLDTYEEE